MISRYEQIRQIVRENPGIQFRQIMRLSGLKNGVVSHHTRRLEENGDVISVRTARQARFYPPGTTGEESAVIKALRRHVPRKVLVELMLNGTMSFAALASKTARSPSTTSYHLAQMVSDGIVGTCLQELKKRYYIKDRDLVERLFHTYPPGMLDRPVSGLEDIVNSL